MSISSSIICITGVAAVITAIIVVFSTVYNDHSNNIPGLISTALAEPITDGNGVIMYSYPSLEHSVYNPLILAGGGLSYFTQYQDTGDSQSKEYFINTANWIVNNARVKEHGRYFIYLGM